MEHCPTCNLQYKRNNKYNHELTNSHLAAFNQYYCQQCKKILNLADKRFHLQSNDHENAKRMWYCDICEKDIKINTKSSHIKSVTHIQNEVISRIINNLTDRTYSYINPDYERVDNLVKNAIDDCTKYFHRFKYKCEFVVKFNHATHVTTNYFTITNKFKNQYEELREADELSHQLDEFEQGESGYINDSIKKLTVKMFKYHDIRASIFCKLPKSFSNSKSIVNIQNNDNYCFLWSILAYKYKVDNHRERVSHSENHFHELNQGDIHFLMKIKDIPTFERLNNLNINVSEISANDKSLSPKYVNKNYYDEQIDLLLYENHYCFITNLRNFCKNNEHYNRLCRRCLNTYGDQSKLEEHMLRCIEQKVCKISYMQQNQKIKFNDWFMKIDPPTWLAADFECMNLPINKNVNDHDNDNVTDKLFVNKPFAIGYNIVKHPDYNNLNLEKGGYIKHFGEDCVEWFIYVMLEKESYMKTYFKNQFEIKPDTIPENYDQNTCWLCQKEFKLKDIKENPIVKDHCHLTGRFRGLAHNNCNLNTRKAHTSFVPILFHNFSGYDCHLISEKLINMATKKNIKINENDIIAISSENYISVKIGCLKFLDSYRFLDASLDKLSKTLSSFPSLDANGMEDDLFKRKLAYPYENCNNIESYYKPLKLGREDYFSNLKQSYPDFEEIIRTQAIIVKNKITNLKELTMLYLKKDVLLLTDIFQNYIDTCKKAYGINPLYSYSTPSFTWKAVLKMTGVKLDYITDDKLRLLLENNMRGGPSSCMGSRYVKRGERKIVYEDMNNLYGWSMSRYLPTGDFREIKVRRSNLITILRTPNNYEHGFLIECDLEYPSSIHKKTKYFPFLPEKKTIKVEDFSNYMTTNKREKYKPTEKLIMDQTNKQRYFLHYRDLKFYIRHEIRNLNVYTVYKFKQSPWLATYIKYNTEQRSKAKTDFEKHFYKLMNNSFYGKTIENIRKRLNLDLIDKSDIHRILNGQSKLPFDDKIAEYEKFNLYSFNKETSKFTKPIYIGFCVLELSKLLMYEWYYDKMQPYFGKGNLELHYLDTDSFIFSFKPIKSLIEDLKHFKDDFDFSDLDPCHNYIQKIIKRLSVK